MKKHALRPLVRYQVSALGLVPSLALQLLAHPKVNQTDFSSVLAITCGAAYLPREYMVKLKSLGAAEVNLSEGKLYSTSEGRS